MSNTTATAGKPTPPAKPTPRDKMVAEVLALKDQVEAVLNEHAPLMKEIGSKIAVLEGDRRQHAGVARQITVLHAKHRVVENMLERIQQTLASIKADPNGATIGLRLEKDQLEAMLADSQELGALASAISDLRSQFNTLATKVDENDVQINARVDDTDRRLGKVAGRVNLLEQMRDKLPVWQLAVGLIVGLAVFLILLPQVFMTPDLTLADGSTLAGVPNPTMNSFWWKAGIGVGVFAVVTGLLIGIGSIASAANRKMKTHQETTWQPPTPPIVSNTALPPLSSSEGTTATTPLPRVPSGVASSSR